MVKPIQNQLLCGLIGTQGNKLYVIQDFSAETKQKRRRFYPIMKAAEKSDAVAEVLDRDKLVINGRTYTVDNLNALPDELKPSKNLRKKNRIKL